MEGKTWLQRLNGVAAAINLILTTAVNTVPAKKPACLIYGTFQRGPLSKRTKPKTDVQYRDLYYADQRGLSRGLKIKDTWDIDADFGLYYDSLTDRVYTIGSSWTEAFRTLTEYGEDEL